MWLGSRTHLAKIDTLRKVKGFPACSPLPLFFLGMVRFENFPPTEHVNSVCMSFVLLQTQSTPCHPSKIHGANPLPRPYAHGWNNLSRGSYNSRSSTCIIWQKFHVHVVIWKISSKSMETHTLNRIYVPGSIHSFASVWKLHYQIAMSRLCTWPWLYLKSEPTSWDFVASFRGK